MKGLPCHPSTKDWNVSDLSYWTAATMTQIGTEAGSVEIEPPAEM